MEAMQIAQRAIVESMGFEKESTGGGCMAYIRHFPGGIHIIVTNGDFDLPDGECWYVGVYDLAGDPLDKFWTGDTIKEYISALNSAIEFAEINIPTTDRLSEEYSVWLEYNGLPDECADSLYLKVIEWKDWLDDFRKRWLDVQAHEDFQQACEARG